LKWFGGERQVADSSRGVAGELQPAHAVAARPQTWLRSATQQVLPRGQPLEISAEGYFAANGWRALIGQPHRYAASAGGDGAAGELQVV
jgi:hypothetical protein